MSSPRWFADVFWGVPPSLARAGRAASVHIVPSNVLAMEGAKKRQFSWSIPVARKDFVLVL